MELNLLVILVLFLGGWWSQCDGCWDQERSALMQLKPYFNNYIYDVNNWGEGENGSNCCEWGSVECDISTGRITHLFLNTTTYEYGYDFFDDSIENDALNGLREREEWYLNISLFLPFQELNTLSLSENSVAGFVHHQGFEELSTKLSKLKHLDLSYNMFNDSILASLANFSSLETLNLASQVNGFDQIEFNEDLFINNILSFFGSLPNLKSLDISSNRLTGAIYMQELNALSNLEELFMSDNQVTDFLPSQDETDLKLVNLKVLDLYDNLFNNSILASLGGLSNLKSLTLELKALKNLEELLLDCEDFSLTDKRCSLPLQSLRLLPSLKTVHLGGFDFDETPRISQNGWHSNFTKLEELDVGESFIQTNILGSIGQFTSLKRLLFSHCEINGSLSTLEGEWHSNFTNLEELYVYDSSIETNFLRNSRQFTALKHLVIVECEMNGSLSALEGICEMTSLQELDLRYNDLEATLPECFSDLASLRNLYLSVNQFFGNISPLENLTSLERLDLSSNQFSGNIHALKSLASLQELMLSDNEFGIPISLGPLFNPSKLKTISADDNSIYAENQILSSAPRFQPEDISLSCCGDVGTFPGFLYHQHDLKSLDLSNIFFKRNQFPKWLLENNTKLESLRLTNSSLSGPLQLPLASHMHLSYLDISDNFFNCNIPTEMGDKLPSLELLNMANTHSIGSIPSSFDRITSLRVMDLSNNKLEGKIFSENSKFSNLRMLKLDGNNFSGRIPDLLSQSPSLLVLDVSNNTLSGTIPRWMGNMSYLQKIVLSNNHLQGTIPIEFCQLDLVLLDLSVNNISGSIPSCLNPSHLTQVHLAKNRLRGVFPNTFRYSFKLVTLDLSDNFLSGNIPSWIGELPGLSYLLLSKNSFQGEIPMELCSLNSLSVINLSHNNLSGRIPPCLKLTTFGDADYVQFGLMGLSTFSLNEPIGFPIKNVYNSYRGRIIPMMSGIDLSCNNLVGQIPHQMGNLNKALVLNLSHNSLTGPIPPTFSNLTQIESLDLSYNQLSGNIPSQLVGLTFLSDFNLSFNNLSGRTPARVAQFGTFDEYSYMGNPFLCGEPLPNCTDTESPPPKPNSAPDTDEDCGFIDMGVFHVTFVVSYIILLLTVAVVLYINPYWRRAPKNVSVSFRFLVFYVGNLNKMLCCIVSYYTHSRTCNRNSSILFQI